MTRGKKFILVMLSLVMTLAMAIGFAACGEKGPKLEAVPAKDASCEYDGNTAYWKDPETGKCYSDEEGQNEIAESDTVIAATGHSYADTWSSDGTNHWHQATCEHKEKLKDRAEHSYPTWKEKYSEIVTNGGKTMTGKEILACTVCGYERSMTEAYQMYVCGNIASYPSAKWDNNFATKDDLAKNCIPLTYDEKTNTFSAEVLLNPKDSFCVYNLTEGQKYPGNAAQSTTGALRVEERNTYVIAWKPSESRPTMTVHEHKFTNNTYKYSGAEHWIECDSGDGAIKEGTKAAHDMASGACPTCGFSPDKCQHEDGYVFTYGNWEGATRAPTPVAEGGTLEKVCPYCFSKQTVSYDVGVTNQGLTKISPLEASKTYYYSGTNCQYIGLSFTTAGKYTLTVENVSRGTTAQDSVSHETLYGIAFSTNKQPTGLNAKATSALSNANSGGVIWGYNAEGGAWFPYEEGETYAAMKAAVENWKNKIVINGDPNYHYDADVGMVDLTSITITVTEDDVKDGTTCYFTIAMAIGTSMSEVNKSNAYLAKLTIDTALAAVAVAPQQVALLPEKKNIA